MENMNNVGITDSNDGACALGPSLSERDRQRLRQSLQDDDDDHVGGSFEFNHECKFVNFLNEEMGVKLKCFKTDFSRCHLVGVMFDEHSIFRFSYAMYRILDFFKKAIDSEGIVYFMNPADYYRVPPFKDTPFLSFLFYKYFGITPLETFKNRLMKLPRRSSVLIENIDAIGALTRGEAIAALRQVGEARCLTIVVGFPRSTKDFGEIPEMESYKLSEAEIEAEKMEDKSSDRDQLLRRGVQEELSRSCGFCDFINQSLDAKMELLAKPDVESPGPEVYGLAYRRLDVSLKGKMRSFRNFIEYHLNLHDTVRTISDFDPQWTSEYYRLTEVPYYMIVLIEHVKFQRYSFCDGSLRYYRPWDADRILDSRWDADHPVVIGYSAEDDGRLE